MYEKLDVVSLTNFSFSCCNSDAVVESEDDTVRKSLRRLLNDDETSFRPPHDLNRLLNDKTQVFSYKKFLKRTEALLQSWTKTVLGAPALMEVYFPNEANKKKRDQETLKRLKVSRERLGDHVEDPLPEVAAAAARARRAHQSPSMDESSDDSYVVVEEPIRKRRGHMFDKKQSATRLTFNGDNGDSGDDDDEEVDDPGNEYPNDQSLLRSPKRHRSQLRASLSPGKKRKSQAKTYDGRRAWTDIETRAIREGIAEYGMGKWAMIKEHFDVILKDRTSGQIKVRFCYVFVLLYQ